MRMFGEKGFGVAEIVVAGALLSIISLASTSLMKNMSRGQANVVRKSEALNLDNMIRSNLYSADFCRCNFGSGAVNPLHFSSTALPSTIAVNPDEELKIFAAGCIAGPILAKKHAPLTGGLTTQSVTFEGMSQVAANLYSATLKISFSTASGTMAIRPVEVSGILLNTSADSGSDVTVSSCQISTAVPFTHSSTYSEPGVHTWTAPPGVSVVIVEGWGAGGGGGAARWWDTGGGQSCGGGGAGAGSYFKAVLSVSPGESYTVSVGAGGIGGAAGSGSLNGADGSAGGNSYFGSGMNFVTARGGMQGLACAETAASGIANIVTGFGGAGGGHSSDDSAHTCNHCQSHQFIEGGAGGHAQFNYTSMTMALGGSGGNSPLGGQGGAHNAGTASNQFPGSAPGGGGGGGTKYNDPAQARPGANGGNGRITVWW